MSASGGSKVKARNEEIIGKKAEFVGAKFRA